MRCNGTLFYILNLAKLRVCKMSLRKDWWLWGNELREKKQEILASLSGEWSDPDEWFHGEQKEKMLAWLENSHYIDEIYRIVVKEADHRFDCAQARELPDSAALSSEGMWGAAHCALESIKNHFSEQKEITYIEKRFYYPSIDRILENYLENRADEGFDLGTDEAYEVLHLNREAFWQLKAKVPCQIAENLLAIKLSEVSIWTLASEEERLEIFDGLMLQAGHGRDYVPENKKVTELLQRVQTGSTHNIQPHRGFDI